jgi:hypothetical protein
MTLLLRSLGGRASLRTGIYLLALKYLPSITGWGSSVPSSSCLLSVSDLILDGPPYLDIGHSSS